MPWLADHQKSDCPFKTHEPCAEGEIERLRAVLVDIREGPCLPICDTLIGAPCDCWGEKIGAALTREA